MTELIVATANPDKIREIKSIWSALKNTKISWLGDYPHLNPPEETGDTLRENAYLKAAGISEITKLPVVSDDTGLFVDHLGGAPGVYSARYAGEDADYSDNVRKLLNELYGVPQEKRGARFITVVCFLIPGSEPVFAEGRIEGRILEKASGSGGFGYDPLFLPDSYSLSFSDMTPDEKNRISHRKRAFESMSAILRSKGFT